MKIQCSVVFWQKYFRNQELFNILLNNLRFIDSTIVSNKFGRHLLPVFLQTSFQIVPLILTRRSIFSNFRHTCSIVIWVRERERERDVSVTERFLWRNGNATFQELLHVDYVIFRSLNTRSCRLQAISSYWLSPGYLLSGTHDNR